MKDKEKIAGKRDPLADGTHDWDISVHYHRCERCGKIMESRDEYVQRLGNWYKDLSCPSCHYHFTVTKTVAPSLGPLFGKRKL